MAIALGEWPEGISPSGSLRTVRDSLPSYGSHRPAVGAWDKVPVSEELGFALLNSVQPGPRLGRLAPQSLELLHGPSNDVSVDARCEGVQLGAVEGPIVVDPASDLGVDIPGEVGQVLATTAVEVPVPDLLAFRFLRLGAHGRGEAHEVASWATGQAAPEGVAEEIEAGVLRIPASARILAVNDLGLLGVQFEAKGPEPLSDDNPKRSGLFLSIAVGNNVVCLCRGPDYADDGLGYVHLSW